MVGYIIFPFFWIEFAPLIGQEQTDHRENLHHRAERTIIYNFIDQYLLQWRLKSPPESFSPIYYEKVQTGSKAFVAPSKKCPYRVSELIGGTCILRFLRKMFAPYRPRGLYKSPWRPSPTAWPICRLPWENQVMSHIGDSFLPRPDWSVVKASM